MGTNSCKRWDVGRLAMVFGGCDCGAGSENIFSGIYRSWMAADSIDGRGECFSRFGAFCSIAVVEIILGQNLIIIDMTSAMLRLCSPGAAGL